MLRELRLPGKLPVPGKPGGSPYFGTTFFVVWATFEQGSLLLCGYLSLPGLNMEPEGQLSVSNPQREGTPRPGHSLNVFLFMWYCGASLNSSGSPGSHPATFTAHTRSISNESYQWYSAQGAETSSRAWGEGTQVPGEPESRNQGVPLR